MSQLLIPENSQKLTLWKPHLAGHSAVLQGCTVEDEAFVGMGATLLDGVVVEKHGMVAAGALVRQNTRIPSGEVVHHFLSCPLPLVLI